MWLFINFWAFLYFNDNPGMSSDLLCNNFEEEWILANLIRTRQCNPDKDSVTLTESLLQAFASKPPFHLSYDTTSKLSWHFAVDKDLANKVHLRRFGVLGQIVMALFYGLLRILTFMQRGIFPLERGMYTFGKYCLETLVKLSLNRRRPSYVMKVHNCTEKCWSHYFLLMKCCSFTNL